MGAGREAVVGEALALVRSRIFQKASRLGLSTIHAVLIQAHSYNDFSPTTQQTLGTLVCCKICLLDSMISILVFKLQTANRDADERETRA